MGNGALCRSNGESEGERGFQEPTSEITDEVRGEVLDPSLLKRGQDPSGV